MMSRYPYTEHVGNLRQARHVRHPLAGGGSTAVVLVARIWCTMASARRPLQ